MVGLMSLEEQINREFTAARRGYAGSSQSCASRQAREHSFLSKSSGRRCAHSAAASGAVGRLIVAIPRGTLR